MAAPGQLQTQFLRVSVPQRLLPLTPSHRLSTLKFSLCLSFHKGSPLSVGLQPIPRQTPSHPRFPQQRPPRSAEHHPSGYLPLRLVRFLSSPSHNPFLGYNVVPTGGPRFPFACDRGVSWDVRLAVLNPGQTRANCDSLFPLLVRMKIFTLFYNSNTNNYQLGGRSQTLASISITWEAG